MPFSFVFAVRGAKIVRVRIFTRDGKPSKPWAWRSRRCRRRIFNSCGRSAYRCKGSTWRRSSVRDLKATRHPYHPTLQTVSVPHLTIYDPDFEIDASRVDMPGFGIFHGLEGMRSFGVHGSRSGSDIAGRRAIGAK